MNILHEPPLLTTSEERNIFFGENKVKGSLFLTIQNSTDKENNEISSKKIASNEIIYNLLDIKTLESIEKKMNYQIFFLKDKLTEAENKNDDEEKIQNIKRELAEAQRIKRLKVPLAKGTINTAEKLFGKEEGKKFLNQFKIVLEQAEQEQEQEYNHPNSDIISSNIYNKVYQSLESSSKESKEEVEKLTNWHINAAILKLKKEDVIPFLEKFILFVPQEAESNKKLENEIIKDWESNKKDKKWFGPDTWHDDNDSINGPLDTVAAK